MQNNREQSVALGMYRHNKSGRKYEVIATALQTETEEYLVIYKPLYVSEHRFFARPLAMFISEIEIDGARVPRFQKITD